MTQAQLAELIGVSRQTIVAIESEKYVPSTVLSLKIARVFNKRVDDIFELEEDVKDLCLPLISFLVLVIIILTVTFHFGIYHKKAR